LITESELNGEFLIISGNAYYSGKIKKFFRATVMFWQGAIIITRINEPLSKINIYKTIYKTRINEPLSKINIYKYIE